MSYKKRVDALRLVSETADDTIRKNVRSNLRSLGLTSSAASTFLALVSCSPTSATTICNGARIPDSRVYCALEELRSKGMITVQFGTPNLYKALSPKGVFTNLKQQLTREHTEKIRRLEDLAQKIEVVRKRTQGSNEIELAHIIKGARNILGKMNKLIASAKKETTALISDPDALKGPKDGLIGAEERGVNIRMAAPSAQTRKAGIKELGVMRQLRCERCVLVVDQRTLLTVSNWKSGDMHAMMTRDSSLITMALRNFTNPICCVKT